MPKSLERWRWSEFCHILHWYVSIQFFHYRHQGCQIKLDRKWEYSSFCITSARWAVMAWVSSVGESRTSFTVIFTRTGRHSRIIIEQCLCTCFEAQTQQCLWLFLWQRRLEEFGSTRAASLQSIGPCQPRFLPRLTYVAPIWFEAGTASYRFQGKEELASTRERLDYLRDIIFEQQPEEDYQRL